MAVGNDLTAPPLSNAEGKLDYKWYTWFNGIYERLKKGPFKVDGFTVANLTNPTGNLLAKDFARITGTAQQAVYTNIVFVINEVGGPTLAFSDGTNWRRVQDRAIIT